MAMSNFKIAQLDELESIPCPCGSARRAFADKDNDVATLHVVDISAIPVCTITRR